MLLCAQALHQRKRLELCQPRVVKLQAAQSTATDPELLKKLEELQKENQRLKQELAKLASAAGGAAAGSTASAAGSAAATEVLEAPVSTTAPAAAGTDAFLVRLDVSLQ